MGDHRIGNISTDWETIIEFADQQILNQVIKEYPREGEELWLARYCRRHAEKYKIDFSIG